MMIRLSAMQEYDLLQWAGNLTSGELAADCEPSGYTLTIAIGGPYVAWATAVAGSSHIELGEVAIDLEHPQERSD